MPSYKDLGLPSMAAYDMARKEQEASEQHKEAMDYIYDRAEFDEDDDGYTECEKCTRTINNYNEPTFVVGIYVDNIRVEQELWCKQCAVKGMKGDLSYCQ